MIERLAQQVVSDDTCNQYADDDSRAPSRRRDNLALYLRRIHLAKPDLILLAKRPAICCRRTGVPFTSDRLLIGDGDPLNRFQQMLVSINIDDAFIEQKTIPFGVSCVRHHGVGLECDGCCIPTALALLHHRASLSYVPG